MDNQFFSYWFSACAQMLAETFAEGEDLKWKMFEFYADFLNDIALNCESYHNFCDDHLIIFGNYAIGKYMETVDCDGDPLDTEKFYFTNSFNGGDLKEFDAWNFYENYEATFTTAELAEFIRKAIRDINEKTTKKVRY